MTFKIIENSKLKKIISYGFIIQLTISFTILGQSFDIPSNKFGISFGNSKNFTGIRFNYRDHNVETISGFNFTLWDSYDNEEAEVSGVSFGVLPGAGYLSGVQLGIGGVAAEKELRGISAGLLGVGAGKQLSGFGIGGLGVGSGQSLNGVFLGGLGVGCGGDVSGFMFGGLGVGAGGSVRGISIGLLGVGAGEDLYGLNLGGLGAGAGRDVAGISFAIFGIGAGKNLTGLSIGGLGVGAGEKVTGITFGGLGVGSQKIRGLTLGGLGVGGTDIKGLSISLGMIRIEEDGGYTGVAASGFNYIKGKQTGLSIAIVNYAYQLAGFQLGLINIVRDNPDYLKVLPLINFNL